MEKPPAIQYPKNKLRTSRNGASSKGTAGHRPFADDADARYAAALKLVQTIDRNLQNGTRHYYATDGRLLSSLDEVIHALLTDTLAAEKPEEESQVSETMGWAPARQMVA
jgi:hypothetical protein